jgi:oxygen-independent coproporphyrinogen-3 oxidase
MDEMLSQILKYYDRPVPRYTSYPPAPLFQTAGGERFYQDWLAGVQGDVSLYIHIPFCQKLCYYCGCHMRVVNHYDPIQNYLASVHQEIDLIKRNVSSAIKITNIHFGGGSPTSVRPDDFKKLMNHLSSAFSVSPDAEISIEADPRNITEALVMAYRQSGVTRLSLGVQSFDDTVLKAINRVQPYEVTQRAVDLCRAHDLLHINFDLMYGLPFQTPESVCASIEKSMALEPSRISFFGYAHVPWMKKHMKLMDESKLPDVEVRYESYQAGQQSLISGGYNPVGLDHFVRPDDSMMKAYQSRAIRRNFQGYTTDMAKTLIGLGVSSIGEFLGGYCQNFPDIMDYAKALENGLLPVSKMLPLNKDDVVRRHVINDLMCYMHVDLADIRNEYKLTDDYFLNETQKLAPYVRDGMVEIDGEKIAIPKDRTVFSRLVCTAFDAYMPPESQNIKRHAQAI